MSPACHQLVTSWYRCKRDCHQPKAVTFSPDRAAITIGLPPLIGPRLVIISPGDPPIFRIDRATRPTLHCVWLRASPMPCGVSVLYVFTVRSRRRPLTRTRYTRTTKGVPQPGPWPLYVRLPGRGLPVASLWSPRGLPVVSLWPPCGLPVVSPYGSLAWLGLARLGFDWLGSVAVGSIGFSVASVQICLASIWGLVPVSYLFYSCFWCVCVIVCVCVCLCLCLCLCLFLAGEECSTQVLQCRGSYL